MVKQTLRPDNRELHRVTQIEGGVEVAVVMVSTTLARPLALLEFEFLVLPPALVTEFGTRVKARNDADFYASIGTFALKFRAEGGEAFGGNMTRKMTIFQHPFHAEVFEGDKHRIFPNNRGNHLVFMILANILNPLIHLLYLAPLLVEVLRLGVLPALLFG